MWLEIAITHTHIQAAENALTDTGALVVSLEDAADVPILEPAPGETPLWPETRAVGLYAQHTKADDILPKIQDKLGILPPYRVAYFNDEDWVRLCLEQIKPMRFGNKLWVCPSHHTIDDPDAVVMRLDPGLAFGTGAHPTTSLCLKWLDGLDLAGKSVLDYGCGSGILAIGAGLLGARDIWAVDIDPQAILATQNNYAQNNVNNVNNGFEIQTGLPDVLPEKWQADVILANILARPLMALAPLLAQRLKIGGQIALAGLLDEQAEMIMACYAPWCEMTIGAQEDGWTRLDGVRIV